MVYVYTKAELDTETRLIMQPLGVKVAILAAEVQASNIVGENYQVNPIQLL